MVVVAHSTSADTAGRQRLRILGLFAHPDDETLCAGGTFAKYAAAGAEVRVVSLTKGGGGPDQGRRRGDLLVGLAAELISEIDPDVVITFGPDGFSGHPDHVAVGAAVTAACYEVRSATAIRLFHCHRPRSRMLLRDRLAEWVVDLTTRFHGTND